MRDKGTHLLHKPSSLTTSRKIYRQSLSYFTWITKYLEMLQKAWGLLIFNVSCPFPSFSNEYAPAG